MINLASISQSQSPAPTAIDAGASASSSESESDDPSPSSSPSTSSPPPLLRPLFERLLISFKHKWILYILSSFQFLFNGRQDI